MSRFATTARSTARRIVRVFYVPESEYTADMWRAKLLREAATQQERDDIHAMFARCTR
jgi:hypothetical protein